MDQEFYRLTVIVETFDKSWAPTGAKGKRTILGCVYNPDDEAEIAYEASKLAKEAVRDMEASRPIEGQ